ncbi:MAG: LPS export ABC transporter periplasmic protein LptC [Gammaproteobacteria bacterium]|nr:LPS export ABC transporter periplasmic protein LptC [Gammaproteobacteria bacterium]
MKKSRLLIFVIIFGIAAIAVGWVYESNLRPQEKEVQLVIPDDIDYFLTNMHYRALNEDGELDFHLYSPRLEHYPHNDVSEIEVPSMQVFRKSDPWQIDAITGEYLHRENLMRLRQEVVMQKQGAQPMRVYTDSIRFEPDRDLVTAESDILMISPQARIKAERAQFDLASKVYRFEKTRAVYHREDS